MAHDDDFWNDLLLGQQSKTASSLDAYLQGREADLASAGMRVLTEKGRAAAALPVPAGAGTRVVFVTNLGSVLTYPAPPSSDTEGTVVMVRTAEGDQTGMDGMVFVKFDDGRFVAIHNEHLRRASSVSKTATSFARRVGSLGDLSGFLRWGEEGNNELVHKATRDLWSFEQTEEGDFTISRLFDDTGEPLQV